MPDFETFICSTALPVLDSESIYPGWFDTVSETIIYPFRNVWMKGVFFKYRALMPYVLKFKEEHGGFESVI